MAQGTSMALWALGVHVLVQTVEGYVLAPLIQRRAVDLPPVLTLAAVALFGTLFGAMGVALATPMVAGSRSRSPGSTSRTGSAADEGSPNVFRQALTRRERPNSRGRERLV